MEKKIYCDHKPFKKNPQEHIRKSLKKGSSVHFLKQIEISQWNWEVLLHKVHLVFLLNIQEQIIDCIKLPSKVYRSLSSVPPASKKKK